MDKKRAPLTNRERQADYRQRMEAAGEKEVRGVWAPAEAHPEVKAKMRALVARMKARK